MKKIKYLFLITISMLVLNSCADDVPDFTSNLNYVTFSSTSLGLVVNKGSSSTIEVELYTTDISRKDRTIGIYVDIDNTTANPASYEIPTSVVIPANTNVGTLNITVSGDINESGEVIVVNFDPVDGLQTGDELTLDVALFCPLNLDDFVGTWEGTTSYGYPTQVVTSINADGQLEITGIGVGFIENDWGEIITDMATLVMDVDLETGNFTIPESYYMSTTYQGAPQDPYYLSAVGSLNACSGQMYLDYDFIQAGTSYTEWLTEGNGYPPFEETITIE